MEQILQDLIHNKLVLVLGIFIVLDTFLGCLRAIKEKKWNSCFGINGLLRKVGMIGSIVLLLAVDCIFNTDFIGFIPEDIKKYIGGVEIGIASLFALLFMLYEGTSIMKNMVLCGLPIPAKLNSFVSGILENFTTELENKK